MKMIVYITDISKMETLQPPNDAAKSAPIKKHPFSVSEDLQIIQFVNQSIAQNSESNTSSTIAKLSIKWNTIALKLGRSSKQVRERWNGHLNPSINKGPWTLNEDVIIATKQKEFGNRWAEIVKYLPGRTDTMIKNRWNTYIRNRVPELLDPNRQLYCSCMSKNSNRSRNSIQQTSCQENPYFQKSVSSPSDQMASSPPSPISKSSDSSDTTINISVSKMNRVSPIDEWLHQLQTRQHTFIRLSDFRQLPPLIQH